VPRRWPRRRIAIVLGLVVVALAIAAVGLFAIIEGSQERLLSGIHDNCIGSATETARARGVDVDVAVPDITQKIERYCSCLANAVKSGEVTTTALLAFSAAPQAVDPATVKVRQVVATCLR
jgi:hypothetical protein